jgi:hypothetical protein
MSAEEVGEETEPDTPEKNVEARPELSPNTRPTSKARK